MVLLPAPAVKALVDEAVVALTELGDDDGLARAWRLASHERNVVGDTPGIGAAMRKALVHARRAGNAKLETEALFWIGLAAFFDDTPVAEGLAICEQITEAAPTPLRRAHALMWTGAIETLGGGDEGLNRVADARMLYAELGLRTLHGGTAIAHGILKLLGGTPEEAEPVLREAAAELVGLKGYRSAVLVLLAQALCRQGRYDEADQANRDSEALTEREDVLQVSLISSVSAEIAVGRGDLDEAERAARQAALLVERAEGNVICGDILMVLAEVLRRVGRATESRESAERALTRYEQKGVVPAMERARTFLAELAPA